MRPEDPVLSVITPVLNGGDRLAVCIESVARLSALVPGQVEHLIADGGSDDGSLELALGARDSEALPVVDVLRGPDSGQSQAINRAAARANGAWVCWLNADDVFVPEAMARLVGCATHDDAASVVLGRCRFVDTSGRTVFQPEPPDPVTLGSLLRPLSMWFAGRSIVQPEALIRRAAFLEAGGLDESNHMSMDHDLWVRLVRAGGRFVSRADIVAEQLVHSGQKTADNLGVAASILRTCERHVDAIEASAAKITAREESKELGTRIAQAQRVLGARPRRDSSVPECTEHLAQAIGRVRSHSKDVLVIGSRVGSIVRGLMPGGVRVVTTPRPLGVIGAHGLVVIDCGSLAQSGGLASDMLRSLRPGGWGVLVGLCDTEAARAAAARLRQWMSDRVTWRHRGWSDEDLARLHAFSEWLKTAAARAAGPLGDSVRVCETFDCPLPTEHDRACRQLGLDARGLLRTVLVQRLSDATGSNSAASICRL